MKKMRKSLGILVAVVAFCMVFAVSAKVDAAETKMQVALEANEGGNVVTPLVTDITKANFVLGTYAYSVTNSNSLRVSGYAPADANYVEAALFDANGTLLQTTRCYVSSYGGYSFSGYFNNLAKNKVYYVATRTIQRVDYQQEVAGNWSEMRMAIFTKCKAKEIENYRSGYESLKIKVPKIKGVKKYKIQVSKKRDTGYKNAKIAKPGKTYTISKCKGKKFKLGKTTYIRVVPVLSNGTTSDIVSIYTL